MGSVAFHKTDQDDDIRSSESMLSTVQFGRFRVTEESKRDLMSVKEFAAEACISRQAVLKMITTGRLQANKIGENYAITRGELNRYLAER